MAQDEPGPAPSLEMLLYLGEFDNTQGTPDDPLEIDTLLPNTQPAVNIDTDVKTITKPESQSESAANDQLPTPSPAPADR